MSLIVRILKKYRGFTLDVSFEADRLPLAILGASGSGKSMTLKCIAGLLTPDEGYIEVDGRVLYDSKKRINLKPQKRKVGYLLQNNALFPNMTVEKNIAQALSGTKAENAAVIRELLGRFELSELGKRYPAQLSGGQQQRVALARILAGKPSVLMLDEPFSALDSYLKETLQLDMKRRLEDYNGYSILVTHDQEDAYRLCSRMLLLDQGKVDVTGNTDEIFDKPTTLTAAKITGCRNISRAVKTGSHHIRALDWNITLETAEEVPDDLSHVGIRAEDFQPANGHDTNSILLCSPQFLEGPSNSHVLFTPDGGRRDNPLWWAGNKNLSANLPDYLSISRDRVLPLRSNGSG